MMRRLLLGVLVFASACRSSSQTEAESSETDSEGASSSETGFPIPDACSAEMPCAAGYCVAPWDASAEPPRGSAECVSECVAELDLDRFCIDDASCCEDLECSLDGLCEVPFTGATDTDSDTGSDTSSDTGSDTSSDTGTGSDTSSG